MNSREKMTFMQLVKAVDDDKQMKLPTRKYLKENAEVFVKVTVLGSTITVYTNGFFVYDDGLHATVQRVSHCCQNAVYEYQDNSREEIALEDFADQPFYVRLAIEGEKRLDMNNIARASGRVYSYDGRENESSDLADEYDFAEVHAERDSRIQVLRTLRSGLADLTEHQLSVLQKYFCEDKTHQEIADELGCSKQAVGKSYRAALKKLRNCIE